MLFIDAVVGWGVGAFVVGYGEAVEPQLEWQRARGHAIVAEVNEERVGWRALAQVYHAALGCGAGEQRPHEY